jgi:pilus assembly protein CpaB
MVRNIRPIFLMLASIVIGIVAVAIAQHWIAQRTEVASIKVVVASRDLPFGSLLREGMLSVIEWPASANLKDPVADPAQIYLRVINTAITRGEPVLISKLAPWGEKGGLSALLHEGSRAITVKINEIVGVAGFALPGNPTPVERLPEGECR